MIASQFCPYIVEMVGGGFGGALCGGARSRMCPALLRREVWAAVWVLLRAASVMILFMFTTKNRRGMLAFVLLRMREAYPSMVQSSLRVFATSEPISKISYGSMFRPAASTALMCPLPLIRPMDSQFVLSNVVALYTKARPVDFIQGKVLPRIDSGRDDGHHKEGPKSKPVWSHFVRVTIAGVLELFSRNGLSL